MKRWECPVTETLPPHLKEPIKWFKNSHTHTHKLSVYICKHPFLDIHDGPQAHMFFLCVYSDSCAEQSRDWWETHKET